MSERNYYVLCDDNCRFEGMTKEQIIAAIAEATGETPTHIDDAFITKIKEMNANAALKMWLGTEAQFNALSPAPTAELAMLRVGTNGVVYFCKDDSTLPVWKDETLQAAEQVAEETAEEKVSEMMDDYRTASDQDEIDAGKAPAYQYSTTDIGEGATLATGTLYFVYE